MVSSWQAFVSLHFNFKFRFSAVTLLKANTENSNVIAQGKFRIHASELIRDPTVLLFFLGSSSFGCILHRGHLKTTTESPA